MSGDDAFAEYRILKTRCGLPTAEHVSSGILLHSGVDPFAEARAVAAEYADGRAQATVLLGGGLGYLAEALAQSGDESQPVFVMEPDSALWQLTQSCRAGASYFTSPRIRHISLTSPHLTARRMSEIVGTAKLIVAPYFERLTAHLSSPLSKFVQLLRAERVSRVVYDGILDEHRRVNQERLRSLPGTHEIRFQSGVKVVVAGAGPSLDECVGALCSHRRQFLLVAASGAVPPLRAAGIDPDWVVALEGRDAVVSDLADLPRGIPTVVFESTHPEIMRTARGPLYCGAGLETRGGTTLIPALDLALLCSTENVILVGADLGYGNRSYAAGANRETMNDSAPSGVPPKFLAMRGALENLLERNACGPRVVYHVLHAAPVLRGARRMRPTELDGALAAVATTKETV
jgi:hypothetical protein